MSNVKLTIDQILHFHAFEFQEVVASPDELEVLLVLGNQDVPEEDYVRDVLKRTLWRLDFQEGEPFQLCEGQEDAHGPRWAPDRSAIAYFGLAGGRTELWTMCPDGSEKRQLSDRRFPARNSFDGCTLLWSPDARSLIYSAAPVGSKNAIIWEGFHGKKDESEGVVLERPRRVSGTMRTVASYPFVGALHTVDLLTGVHRKIAQQPGVSYRPLEWFPDARTLLVAVGDEIRKIDIQSGVSQTLYKGTIGRPKLHEGQLLLGLVEVNHLKIGAVIDGVFEERFLAELPGEYPVLHDWSSDGSHLYGTCRERMSHHIFEFDLSDSSLRLIMKHNATYAQVSALTKSASVLFVSSSPSEPQELYSAGPDLAVQKLTRFNDLGATQLGEVRTVTYPSDDCDIEALLVLPPGESQGRRFPALVFAHPGPEYMVSPSFEEVISARAMSGAHWLAAHGYAVLLPNFRGSAGYGPEFRSKIGNHQIMSAPYRDLMAGIDYLIESHIADSDALGIYGASFGGWLAAWAITQTSRFKGAICAIAPYDILSMDRQLGIAFHEMVPSRLGESNPAAMWEHSEVYGEFSPVEHVSAVQTPVLLIETSGERRNGSLAQPFLNGVSARGVETFVVFYPGAMHNGAWNDDYKRDYLKRIVAWFDHCLRDAPLPEWFDPYKED